MADPLALAVTQLPGWRWRAGMLGLGDGADGWRARVLAVGGRGIPDLWASYLWRRESDGSEWAADPVIVPAWNTPAWAVKEWRGVSPDLDDDATGGCLLGMLDEVTAHDMHAVPLYAGGWLVTLTDGPAAGDYDAPTLARACAPALVAVGRCA